MVQAVWPGSSKLLGWCSGRVWFRLCGQGLVSCLDGSARVLVQAVWPGSSQLLGWFRPCAQGLSQ